MLLFLYLLGIPIIVVLILTSTRMGGSYMKILLTPVFKFQKGEEAL
jgi:hypothetical protein